MNTSYAIKSVKPSVNQVSGNTYLELTIQILKASFRDFIDRVHRNQELYSKFVYETSKAKVDYLAKNREILNLMAEELAHLEGLEFEEAAVKLLNVDFWVNDEDIQLFDYTYV